MSDETDPGRPFTLTLANREDARFQVSPDQTLLEALEAQGVVLPFGCRYGGCITCAARLLEGTVDQSAGVALKPHQIDAGYVLLCVTRPRSNCVLEVGVESQKGLYRNPFRDGSV